MSELKKFRIVGDGTYFGTKVYAPDGTDLSESVVAAWVEIVPERKDQLATVRLEVLADYDLSAVLDE